MGMSESFIFLSVNVPRKADQPETFSEWAMKQAHLASNVRFVNFKYSLQDLFWLCFQGGLKQKANCQLGAGWVKAECSLLLCNILVFFR